MANMGMGGFAIPENKSGQFSLPMALAGAAAGAVGMALVYGVVGRLVAEFAYVSFLIGVASGFLAVRLGGGRNVVAGIGAAVFSLVAVLGAKLIVGAPEGYGFVEYHTTPFDILFCYVLTPATGFLTAGSERIRELANRVPYLNRLPF